MRIVTVIHSVCGNTYLVAKAFQEEFLKAGREVSLLRVADPSWTEKPDLSDKAREVLSAMRALPEAKPVDLLSADMILMGSPTYFGNVSAQMKAFMDSTGGVWFKGQLVGKKFAAFASAGNTEGGGDLCLAALHTYAKYMGMFCAPLPVTTLPGENVNALGIIQYSNGKYAETLDPKTRRIVSAFVHFLATRL
jgi:NAD(P)H dehydrogenase (quinone)